MLRCDRCGEIFSEDDAGRKKVCMEDYYGVGSMFPDRHYKTFLICPNCGSEEIDEYYECDEDEEEEDETE